jgi:hypothetical protein
MAAVKCTIHYRKSEKVHQPKANEVTIAADELKSMNLSS